MKSAGDSGVSAAPGLGAVPRKTRHLEGLRRGNIAGEIGHRD